MISCSLCDMLIVRLVATNVLVNTIATEDAIHRRHRQSEQTVGIDIHDHVR